MSITSTTAERPFLVLAWACDDSELRSALRAAGARYLLETVRDGGLEDALEAISVGGGSDHPAGDLLAHLTGQERRVLDLIGEGLSNREISLRLGLAEKTVKNYVTSLLAKMGMRRRTQAAAYIARHTARHRTPDEVTNQLRRPVTPG